MNAENRYMIERYMELFESVNPYEYELLQKTGLLQNHFSVIENEFDVAMRQDDIEEPVERRYEASGEINGDMIAASENQIFLDNLERFMDTYLQDSKEQTILYKLSIEVPGTCASSFPWNEVKLFAEKLQPKVHDISSELWQEAFDLYLVERIHEESFRTNFEDYFDYKL